MKKLLLSFALALIMLLAVPLIALAIADPDTDPQVSAVYVYEDLLEEGDVGVLVDYFIDYTISGNPPTGETATEAYMAIFIDTDGVTQLQAVAPYAFDDLGYGRGLVWIYFTPAEALGIDRANQALYEVWLVGNPGLGWVPGPDPPKTIAGIDYWQPLNTSTSTLFALRVLQYGQTLGSAWTETLVQETAGGHRLTAFGESYFMNVIPDLRDIALSVFASGETNPVLEPIDYSTTFGATFTNDGGTATGSPITLGEGANTVDVLTLGTFTIELTQGTVGTAVSDICQVTNTPVPLVAGTNTITTTAPIGDITVTVALVNTQTVITDTITGTGWDLTEVAARFGMTRWMFSGGIWLLITVIACGGLYKSGHGSGKGMFFLFLLFLTGGSLLGLLSLEVTVVMFICCGIFTGYMLFLKHSSLTDKGIIFFIWAWLIFSLAGGIMQGGTSSTSATLLTAAIDDSDNIITVTSTEGFADSGIIVILDERIAYAATTATTFRGSFGQPLFRGTQDTTATNHSAGEVVRTVESSLLNQSLAYKLAVFSDSSGTLAFFTMAYGFITGLITFLILPVSFLSTDLWLFTILWAGMVMGFLAALAIALIGGRRV